MGFMDVIKKSVIEEFTGTISTLDIFLSLLVAILAAIIVVFIYKKTYTGVSYTKSFSLSILLLAMVTSLVIRTINSNLALSLGMVGALSIVRFRTAVKDPVDTIFMFWAITVGIMSGAGLYLTTLIATIILGLFYFVASFYQFKTPVKYLLVIKANKSIAGDIKTLMDSKKKSVLKTESYKNDDVELTYELGRKELADEILTWNTKKEVKSINLVNID